jgi:uncharacterized protein (TIGR02265 family)
VLLRAPVARLETLPPDFTWNVEVNEYLDACPHGATTRGTFFQHVRDRVRESLGEEPASFYDGLQDRSWSAFQSYPLTDFMKVAHRAALLVYPAQSTSEGLRRIGWLSYKSFMATTAGRIVLFALGHRFEDVLHVGPTAYRITLPSSVVRVERLDERRYRYEMRNVHSFVDSYHYGVLEGAFVSFGLTPSITMRRLGRLCDADFDLSW